MVCLFPGDTLEFSATPHDILPYQFSGNRMKSELMFYSLLETKQLGMLIGNQELQVTKDLNFEYVADRTQKRYKTRLKSLEEESNKDKFSIEGYNTTSLSLYYRYLSELLFPYQAWKPIEEIKKNADMVPSSYKAKLSTLESEFDKDSLMYLLDYRRFILQYARFMMVEKSNQQRIDLLSLLEYYKNTFRGKKRDLLLFDEIVLNYQAHGHLVALTGIIDSIETQSMRDTLMSIQRKSDGEFSKHALESELETVEGGKIRLREVLTKFSSKMILLDFWATWCKPCLMEMPDSKTLTQELKDDNIDFIYLSIDEDPVKWRKKLSTLHTGVNIQHFRFINGEKFINEMGIQAVPRYILLSVGGKVISSSAPRPGSIEIRQLISHNIIK